MRMVTETGAPLQRRYYTSRDGRQLTWDDIVRGYEVEKGTFVLLDDDELERLAPEKTGGIDLREFVKASAIDAMYFERGYYLVPDEGSSKAYRLLAAIMERTERAGIATFVMRGKEYLVAIFAEHGILRAETLRFSDELRTPESIGLPKPARVAAADVTKMERAIEKLAEKGFDERELVDQSAVRLLDVVEKKLEKDEDVVELPRDTEDAGARSDVIDLMSALEKSLRKGRSAAKPARRRSRKQATR